ncbi:MAG: DUF4443 domain-containing protein [Candidatus Altiarchaeota archaeon]
MAGAAPSFTDIHLVRSILLLANGPLGRKRLVQELGVGEGSVRTILKRLWSDGLVESYKGGQRLSKKGEKKASKLLGQLWIEQDFNSADLSGQDKKQVLVIVKKGADNVASTVLLRDQSLKAGADGAVIIQKKKGKLIFPDDSTPLDGFPDLIEQLSGEELKNEDIAVVAWGDTTQLAEDGALTIALQLISR